MRNDTEEKRETNWLVNDTEEKRERQSWLVNDTQEKRETKLVGATSRETDVTQRKLTAFCVKPMLCINRANCF